MTREAVRSSERSSGASPVFRPATSRPNPVLAWLSGRLQWVSLATFALIWEIVGQVGWFRFLPPVSEIAQSWLRLIETGQLNAIIISLQALAVGFGLALVLGVAVAILTASSKTADYVLDPYLNVLLATPTTALVPVFMIMFGLGFETRVVVIFMYSFFVIVINFQAGLRGVDPAHAEMAASFGAGRVDMLRRVTLPTAMPLVLTGLRLGLSRGLRGMVNAEVIISITGIGGLLIRYGRMFDMASLYAIIFTIITLAIISVSIIYVLEKRLLRWQR